MPPTYQPSYTATAATSTIVSAGLLELHTIVVPKLTVGTLSYQDTAGTVYFAFPTGVAAGTYTFDCVLNNGLKIVQASASDQITTNWKKP